jgi:hypothetical protein
MLSLSFLGVGVQAIVSLLVGVRLASLARRTGRFPELALSLATLLMPVVGYPAALVAIGLERAQLPGVTPVFFVAVSAMMIGVSLYYAFTWRVFRPDAAWAALLWALGSWLMIGSAGAATGHLELLGSIDAGVQSARVWAVATVLAVCVAYTWNTLESFRYYLNSRRQLRLGLVDPAVCNRFLLWSMSTGGWLVLAVVASVGLVTSGKNPLESAGFSLAVGVVGLVNSACNTLCFMPPRWYLDWLSRPRAAQGL